MRFNDGHFDWKWYAQLGMTAVPPYSNKNDIGDLNPIFVGDCLTDVPDFIDVIVGVLEKDEKNIIRNTKGKPYHILTLNDYGSGRDFYRFRDCVEFVISLVNDHKKVLVHCAAGINRSPSVACAAYAQLKKISMQDAINKFSRTRQMHPEESYIIMGQFLNREFEIYETRHQ